MLGAINYLSSSDIINCDENLFSLCFTLLFF